MDVGTTGPTGVERGALEPANRRVVDAAAAAGLDVAVRRDPAGTRSAVDAARAVGCDVERIVKSLVFVGDGTPFLVLTAGSNRVDEARAGAALGLGDVRRATPAEVLSATGFPVGGTAPWGHDGQLPVLCDADLLAHDEVWAAAGTAETVFAVAPSELVRVAGAVVAEIAS